MCVKTIIKTKTKHSFWRYKMKKRILILMIAAAVLIFTSCGKADVIVLKDMNGNDIEVSTEGMTADQIEALKDMASGDSNMMEIMRSGVFTADDIAEMGFGTRVGMNSSQAGMNRDYSNVNIEDLNLDGLSQEQIDVIENIIREELTMQEAIKDGVLSMEDLMETGLVGKLPQGNGQRGKPAN